MCFKYRSCIILQSKIPTEATTPPHNLSQRNGDVRDYFTLKSKVKETKQTAQSWTSMTIIQYRPDKNFKFRPSYKYKTHQPKRKSTEWWTMEPQAIHTHQLKFRYNSDFSTICYSSYKIWDHHNKKWQINCNKVFPILRPSQFF